MVLVALDSSKAFKTIHPELKSVTNLKHYELCIVTNNFFTTYLTETFLKDKIDGNISYFKPTCSGVLEESILGPLLFFIYPADLHRSVKHSMIACYADDIQLLYHFDSNQDFVASQKFFSL